MKKWTGGLGEGEESNFFTKESTSCKNEKMGRGNWGWVRGVLDVSEQMFQMALLLLKEKNFASSIYDHFII